VGLGARRQHAVEVEHAHAHVVGQAEHPSSHCRRADPGSEPAPEAELAAEPREQPCSLGTFLGQVVASGCDLEAAELRHARPQRRVLGGERLPPLGGQGVQIDAVGRFRSDLPRRVHRSARPQDPAPPVRRHPCPP